MSEQLSDDARQLLNSVQGCDDPTEDDRTRVKRAVMLAVAGGAVTGSAAAAVAAGAASSSVAAGAGVAAAGGGAAVAGGAVATAGTGVAGGLLIKVVSTALVVAAVGGGSASVYQMLNETEPAQEAPAEVEDPGVPEPPPSARPQAVTPPAEPEPEPEVEPEVEPEPEPEVEVEPEPALATPRPAQPRGRPQVPQVEDSLGAEVELLRRAQQARAAGDSGEALRLLSEHAQRFPRGSLRMEREVSRILVYCESGQRARGVSLAERFLSRNASSPAAARVRGACGLAE